MGLLRGVGNRSSGRRGLGWVWLESGLLRCAAHKRVSSFGRKDKGFCCEVGENRQRQRRRGVWVERYGWFWLVEFFGILRCAQDDSKNRQRQEPPQVLRLRCSESAVSNFAQDGNILDAGEKETGKGR